MVCVFIQICTFCMQAAKALPIDYFMTTLRSPWLEIEGLRVRVSLEALLLPWTRLFILCLVPVKPRKIRPDMTEKCLLGGKE